MKRTTLATTVLAGALALSGCAADDGGGSGIAFAGIADGDTVSSPVAVDFATTGGFEVVPAAEGGGDQSGHMHVMVDVGCVAVGEVIPSDDSHIHFGDGSTSAELELEPGEHSLCLQAGDGEHTAMDVTDEITITVE